MLAEGSSSKSVELASNANPGETLTDEVMVAVTVNEAVMEAQTTKELEIESTGELERSDKESIEQCMV
jgi:hypothetical protein